jgi:hypothetical protein
MRSNRSIPEHRDSIGKLLSRLALVAKANITSGGKVLTCPTEIYLSPSLLRGFRCRAGCTACCLPFTLDYTPEEFTALGERWRDDIAVQAQAQFSERSVEVNGVQYPIMTYEQYKDPACPYLRPTRENGALGCGFWTSDNTTQPLECAAAPQLLMTTRGEGISLIMKKPFGRAWAWKQKPQCEFDPRAERLTDIPDTYDLSPEIALLERYAHWAAHFAIPTYLEEIIAAMRELPSLIRAAGGHMVRVIPTP